jgi:ribonucleoside-diphosphate reductase alpha chain
MENKMTCKYCRQSVTPGPCPKCGRIIQTDSLRPVQQHGDTPRKKTGCGWLYITDCTTAEYKEVFLRLGKTGGCPAAFLQALAKIISLGLRRKLEKEDVVRMLAGISCPNPMWDGPVQILSCPDAVAKALKGNED